MIARLVRAAKRRVHRWRSAVTGRFVSQAFAKANPRETTGEKANQ